MHLLIADESNKNGCAKGISSMLNIVPASYHEVIGARSQEPAYSIPLRSAQCQIVQSKHLESDIEPEPRPMYFMQVFTTNKVAFCQSYRLTRAHRHFIDLRCSTFRISMLHPISTGPNPMKTQLDEHRPLVQHMSRALVSSGVITPVAQLLSMTSLGWCPSLATEIWSFSLCCKKHGETWLADSFNTTKRQTCISIRPETSTDFTSTAPIRRATNREKGHTLWWMEHWFRLPTTERDFAHQNSRDTVAKLDHESRPCDICFVVSRGSISVYLTQNRRMPKCATVGLQKLALETDVLCFAALLAEIKFMHVANPSFSQKLQHALAGRPAQALNTVHARRVVLFYKHTFCSIMLCIAARSLALELSKFTRHAPSP